MKGICLTFYAYEFEKHGKKLVYEWLLETGKTMGLPGGHVNRGIAGFGKHKKMYEEHFFELGANVPIEIQFILNKEDSDKFLAAIQKENIHLFYTLSDIDYNTT